VTESALFGLSQLVYENAGKVKEIADLREQKVTRTQMILRAIGLLKDFLTHYPTNPAADQASFSMANAFLELEDYAYAADLTRQFEKRYPDSTYLDGFQYTRAYCAYALGRYDEALADCTKVATAEYALPGGARGPSKNKWLAYYIMGQIYHSRNMPAKAIEFYKKVATQFADAAQSIEYFDHKALSVPEITTFKPGEAAKIEITYRNITAADVKVYRVDLMKLYLLHKNLDRITRINLAGITPQLDATVPLGDGADYADKKHTIDLKLDKVGAYLVVLRGENLNRSGMVLISPLTLDVTEDVASGQVRVNVKNAVTGAYAAKVHIKAIGVGNADFQSGETDLRGIYVAEGIQGKCTVIAKDTEGRFAFFRGEQNLGGYGQQRQQQGQPAAQGQLLGKGEMLQNVLDMNKRVQGYNVKGYRDFQSDEAQAAGVQVMQAK
jgi:tetratricopeptide (TPR) repeat protein